MKVDIKAAAAPAQNYLDQTVQNNLVNSILGGAMKGIQAGRQYKLSQDRTAGFKNALTTQYNNYEKALQDPNLSATDRLSLQDAMSRLDMMGSTTDVSNIDAQMGSYQKMYSPMSDPRALANELKKAIITGQYNVQAAGAYGAAKKTPISYEDIVELGGLKNKRLQPNPIQGVMDFFGGIFNPSSSGGGDYESFLNNLGN